MQPAVRVGQGLVRKAAWDNGEPLWKVVPKHDEHGAPLADFMMIASGLNKRAPHEIETMMDTMVHTLEEFQDWVVFADFNFKLNLLWISHRQSPGVMSQIVSVMHARLPMFKLVGHLTEGGR